MNNGTHPTVLEQLPIEIFSQIFASFSLPEIVTVFSGLNSRIDSYIQAVTNTSHIVFYDDTKAIDLLHFFSSEISRLIVTHSPSVDFTSLIHLRSLTLKYGTVAQFDRIRPEHFPRLEILHLCGSE